MDTHLPARFVFNHEHDLYFQALGVMGHSPAKLNPDNYLEWLYAQVDGKPIPATTRHRASAGCFQLALEHHQSIVTLIRRQLHGSAFSLLRSSYESYVLGEWLQHCATDDQIERFVAGRGAPKIDRMLGALERVHGFEERVLTEVKRAHWKTMSEYAHPGALQVQRRQTDDAVESNYSEAEINEVADLAEIFGSVSVMAILGIAGEAEAAETVFNAMKARSIDA